MKKRQERELAKSPQGYLSRPMSLSLDASYAKCGGVHAGAVDAALAAFSKWDTVELPLRESAEQLIVEAMEAEVRLFRAQFGGLRDAQGRAIIVRNGFQPAREIATAVGRIAVRIPKLRHRDGNAVPFRSVFIPHYVRRCDAVDAARQCNYLNALLARNVTAALESLFNGRLRYVPTPVMQHLREWWARHCENMLA
jgi:hypothetical protein